MASEEKKIKRIRKKLVPAQYRRKRRSPKGVIIIAAVVLVCVCTGALLLPKWLSRDSANADDTQATLPLPNKVIHIVAGGDINITDQSVAAGAVEGGYNYTQIFRDVVPVLSRGDVTVLNFEGVLGGTSYGTATKTAPPELMKALSAAGVDIIQTANSYSVFDGLRGLNATLQGVQNAGMTPLGTYASNASFQESGGYLIWEIQGIKVAFMAFTKGVINSEGEPARIPAGSESSVNLLYTDYSNTYQNVDKDGITQIVRNAAAHKPDVMVALLHWGSEFNDKISKSQDKICKILQDEGVDAIIGTHSHYVQKMQLDPSTGRFVAYSLGDFYGDSYGDGKKISDNYSVLLDLEITQDAVTKETKITGFEYVPIFLHKEEDGKLQILRIKEAMAAYENQYVNRVSEATYQAMKTALARIASRTGVKS